MKSVLVGAAATAVALLAGGLVADLAWGPDAVRDAPLIDPVVTADSPLEVSGSGVGSLDFGSNAEEVVSAVSAELGEPDLTVGPLRFSRIRGHEGWFQDADDAISLSWGYPVASVSCWRVLCLVMGGQDQESLQLRGWELAEQPRWSEFEAVANPQLPDIRLAETGIRLGDPWAELHTAYPATEIQGAEGASVAVRGTPWAGISDGAAAWRLSGTWDHRHPATAPDGAVVTRLSGGEGPQPGCC